jgi:hypothetical protein
MVTSVTDNSYLDNPSPTQTSQPPAKPAAAAKMQSQPQTQSQQDQVKLSTTAQAKALKSQGATVSQIAQSLGLSTAVVDQLLGITDTSTGSDSGNNYSASQVQQLLNGV